MVDIRFDDVEALRGRISEAHGAWGKDVEVTQAMIDAFAELTGDHQWIHVDVERAKREAPLGTTIAHGFLTLSLLGRLRPPEEFKIVGYQSILNYGSDGLRFLGPVPSGSRVHARQRLLDVRARPNGTLVVHEIAVHVVGNEKPALVYKGMVLYQPPRGAAKA
jgi:acyl dehydratase